ncbi:MAG: glycosyltransferase family 4 protein [Dinoroseobacter sp.]|nr:glycosyltransferase family 4 protein [Dinoroseobacter sp.]
MPATSPSLPRLAYVTSTYPAASHTFILREVTELEALGFQILPCAVREPAPDNLIGPEEAAAHAKTFYVLNAARKLPTLPRALLAALKQPGRFLKTLGLAVRTTPPGLKGALWQSFYVAEALILARHLRAEGIDHIHNHFGDQSATVSMLTSALSGIPFSYTLHGPNDLYEPYKWRFDEKTARAAFVACISHFARSQVMYFSDPVHWDKLRIVHCGVVPERYDRPRTDHDGTRLLFVGRLTPVKGVRLLLEALTQASAVREDITLDIIGDGEDRAHLEALAAPLGAKVRFLGYRSQEEVAEALSTADVLVLPSFAEGLPVVLMEALAAATPVICSQVAGVAELVEDGRSGFVIPAGDVATLTDRILTLAADPARGAEMGRHGQARVRAEFDIRVEAGRIGRLFAEGPSADLRPVPFGGTETSD